ncbi:hypothetical protein K2173_000852 [Erythroxylum novogranatense]|uniref:Ribosomal protein L32 n=1 Tax=Erythroxylum novogranatense TaxID=1862640 RepID=A0AAV8S8B6_9ROSI|nr:hypothetical protein K2173_000852 [Erythroxylum novogranatense]
MTLISSLAWKRNSQNFKFQKKLLWEYLRVTQAAKGRLWVAVGRCNYILGSNEPKGERFKYSS